MHKISSCLCLCGYIVFLVPSFEKCFVAMTSHETNSNFFSEALELHTTPLVGSDENDEKNHKLILFQTSFLAELVRNMNARSRTKSDFFAFFFVLLFHSIVLLFQSFISMAILIKTKTQIAKITM